LLLEQLTQAWQGRPTTWAAPVGITPRDKRQTSSASQISQKVLVQQLQDLEEHRLIHRDVLRQVPPRVDYSATPLGLSLEPFMLALCAWGTRHARELNELDGIADCIVRPANTERTAGGAR
jgi:hypothetical protein